MGSLDGKEEMGKGGRRVERGRFDPACAPG